MHETLFLSQALFYISISCPHLVHPNLVTPHTLFFVIGLISQLGLSYTHLLTNLSTNSHLRVPAPASTGLGAKLLCMSDIWDTGCSFYFIFTHSSSLGIVLRYNPPAIYPHICLTLHPFINPTSYSSIQPALHLSTYNQALQLSVYPFIYPSNSNLEFTHAFYQPSFQSPIQPFIISSNTAPN